MYQDEIAISQSLDVLDQLDEAFAKNGKQYDTNGKALVAAGQEIQRLQGWIKSMGRELDEKDRKINALRKELGYPW